MGDTTPLLKLSGITKRYEGSAESVLDKIDLTVQTGDTLAVVGPSGCGKSTMLNLIGGLDSATEGSIEFASRNVASLSEKELADYRNQSIGFIFQSHHLLPQCTALENVLIPTLIQKNSSEARERATELLKRVGLEERMTYRPGKLSGGECQRVAVVRALINKPKLLLADEPTGSLSQDGADDLTKLLLDLNREEGMALIVVTHSLDVARSMDRVLELRNGRFTTESKSEEACST